jgi:hypothetical protein
MYLTRALLRYSQMTIDRRSNELLPVRGNKKVIDRIFIIYIFNSENRNCPHWILTVTHLNLFSSL